MPATIIGRPECKEETWEALKRHIIRSRKKKKEEQEADAEEARIRREKVQQQNQDLLTLDETKQKITNILVDLSKLKAKKRQLFNELKKVLHEDEIRKKNLNKDSEHKTPMKGYHQEVPSDSRANYQSPGVYIFPPTAPEHKTGSAKRTRSLSPMDPNVYMPQPRFPQKIYPTLQIMGHEGEGRPVGIDPEYEEPRPRFGGERAVLWNKPTGPVKFEQGFEPIPYPTAPGQFGYLAQPMFHTMSDMPSDKQAAEADREKERERQREREREREQEQREREKEREREREREREQRERETPPKAVGAGGPPPPSNVQYLNQSHPGAPPSQASYSLLVPAPNIHYTTFQQTPQGLKPVKAGCIASTPVTLVGPGNPGYPVHPSAPANQQTRAFVPPPLMPTQQPGNIAVYAGSPSSRHIYSPGGPPPHSQSPHNQSPHNQPSHNQSPHNPPRHATSQPSSIPVSHPSGHPINHPQSVHQNSHPVILQRRAPRPPYDLPPLSLPSLPVNLTEPPVLFPNLTDQPPPPLPNNGYMVRKDIREYKIVVTGREQGKFPNGTGER